jgi:hypothetical protein
MAGSDGGALDQEQADAVRIEYRALLMEGEVECPPPDEDKEERKGKRGRKHPDIFCCTLLIRRSLSPWLLV